MTTKLTSSLEQNCDLAGSSARNIDMLIEEAIREYLDSAATIGVT